MGKTTAIILAAGKGTRMRSLKPKVLHEVCGITLLECVIEVVQQAGISPVIVVVGDKKEAVKKILEGRPVEIVEQREQLGTAHAVLSAKHLLSNTEGAVLVLNGDTPLVKPQTLKRLTSANNESYADMTLLTACLDKPLGYGRISRDSDGNIKGIVEENDASTEELRVKEINVGMYVFRVESLLEGLGEIVPHNKKNEFYLTDIISIFYRKGKKINEIKSSNTDEVLGINTQSELAKVNQIRHSEILLYHMEQGVTILDCASTFIENHVKIGEGTTIYPFTYICKNVVIGQRCSVGPFVHIRPNTEISNDIEIRNTIER